MTHVHRGCGCAVERVDHVDVVMHAVGTWPEPARWRVRALRYACPEHGLVEWDATTFGAPREAAAHVAPVHVVRLKAQRELPGALR